MKNQMCESVAPHTREADIQEAIRGYKMNLQTLNKIIKDVFGDDNEICIETPYCPCCKTTEID